MTLYGYRIPMWVALILWFVVWEIVGQTDSVMLIPPITTILGSFVEVVTTRSFKEAVSVSLQAFGMGMALSLTVGLTVGFLMARYKAAGDIGGMWINIMESSPISAVVPLLLAIIGFGMQTMVVTVFLFSVWVIALDTQVGVQHANKSLIEMARSFGASRIDLYRKVVFWAALPEILAGIRLGTIRGVKGVIIGQLLIAITGVGYLLETYSRKFLMPQFWALVLIVFAFAYVISEGIGYLERRVAIYAASR
jgi:NitT/TauT family transport system permease protein